MDLRPCPPKHTEIPSVIFSGSTIPITTPLTWADVSLVTGLLLGGFLFGRTAMSNSEHSSGRPPEGLKDQAPLIKVLALRIGSKIQSAQLMDPIGNIETTKVLSFVDGCFELAKKKFDLVVAFLSQNKKENEASLAVLMRIGQGTPVLPIRAHSESIGFGPSRHRPFHISNSTSLEASLDDTDHHPSSIPCAVIKVGRLSCDTAVRRFYVNNLPIKLTPTEYGVLWTMLTKGTFIATSDDIIKNMRRGSREGKKSAARVYVYRLRKLLHLANAGVEIVKIREGYLIRPEIPSADITQIPDPLTSIPCGEL